MDWILPLRGAGMFSNVNQFLESVRRCQDQDQLFVDWRLSRYAEGPHADTFSDFFDWPTADPTRLQAGGYRPFPTYTLSLGKGKHKLKTAESSETSCRSQPATSTDS